VIDVKFIFVDIFSLRRSFETIYHLTNVLRSLKFVISDYVVH